MTQYSGASLPYQTIFAEVRLILHCIASSLQDMPAALLDALSGSAPITQQITSLMPCSSSQQSKVSPQVTHSTARLPSNGCDCTTLASTTSKGCHNEDMHGLHRLEESRCTFACCKCAHIYLYCRGACPARECTRSYKPRSRQHTEETSELPMLEDCCA